MLIGQLRCRCKNGPEDGGGGGEGGAAPRAKCAKLEPAQSMRVADLREELGRRGQDTRGKKGELAARLEDRRSDGGEDGKQTCSWRGRVSELAEHLAVCGHEEVGCPCPGCEERMARAEVEQHVAASGAEHLRRAWGRAVEVEAMVAGLEEKAEEMEEEAEEMKEKVTEMEEKAVEQDKVIVGLERRAGALMRVFVWSTDSEWSVADSDSYTFTGGVVGRCFNRLYTDEPYDGENHLMAFLLEEGPVCTMHFKCSILDKNDKVLRVVSDLVDYEFWEPPTGKGATFTLTDADKAGAVRADGSIKLCMVVYLYLPWM